MDQDEAVSSWHLEADRAAFPPPAELPERVDAVVIGGGVMGAAVCYWLARAGLDVLLAEARRLAWGASGRNAGLALAGRDPLEDVALLRQVLGEERLDVGYAQPGHLALASSPAIWERICAEVARRPPDLPVLHALDRPACEDLLGRRIAPRFYGGRWLTSGGMLHPVRFVYGLAAAAQRRGARIAPETPVRAILRPRFGELSVETGRGRVRARAVVCACGAAVPDLLPELAQVFSPIRGQVLATEPLPPLFAMGMAVDWGTVYWRQAADGTVVLGGYRGLDPAAETGRAERLNPRIQEALGAFLPEAFPGFPPFRVARRWAGIMDETEDGRPLIGPVPGSPGCWALAGFGGHGMPPALGAGKALADAIVGGVRPAALDRCDPARFLQGARIEGA
jgi:glycine/D-amino acid oxidase-like deaminating enzyme